jgi:hypothetical protein
VLLDPLLGEHSEGRLLKVGREATLLPFDQLRQTRPLFVVPLLAVVAVCHQGHVFALSILLLRAVG